MNTTHKLCGALLWLAASPGFASDAPIQILSTARAGQYVTDAQVIMQRHGTSSVSVTTDSDGIALLDARDLDSKETVLIIRKSGFEDFATRCPCAGLSYALVPLSATTALGEPIRIELTWGYRRYGFEAHLAYPDNHVYFGRERGEDAVMTSTDKGGGSETIVIQRRHDNKPYVFAVHDYWNTTRPEQSDLSSSQVRVAVYVGDRLVRRYAVPRGEGNLWTVFRLTESGQIKDINAFSSLRVGSNLVMDEVFSAASTLSGAAEASDADVARINNWGEQAYRDARYDDAIELFTRAILLHPDDGQLYGNLAMAYQKSGRPVVAAWANRRAIALANGPDNAVLRASSYYNLGRLSENAGRRGEARANFRAAQREYPSAVYENAIRRLGADR